MIHSWMSLEEAITRLRTWQTASEEAAQSNPDWLLDRVEEVVGDQRFRVDAFSQNCVFTHAADVVAFDIAIAALELLRKNVEMRLKLGGS